MPLVNVDRRRERYGDDRDRDREPHKRDPTPSHRRRRSNDEATQGIESRLIAFRAKNELAA